MLDARIKKRLGNGIGNSLTIDVMMRAGDGITVLFGPSGAGKTSILRAIAGVTAPDEGRITLNGDVYFDSANRINLPMQHRRIGYVFQNHVLFPHLTAEQNVLYGTGHGSRLCARERVRDLFELMGIENTAPRYPYELSGGEQQRVALARALATDPLLMLLDEPLSAVDVATRSRLLEEISSIQKRSRIPFLYVTHNQSEAARLGNAMILIDEGKVLQEGAPLEVFNAPRTAPVARIVGTENIFVGQILKHSSEDGTTVVEMGSCKVEIPYNGLAPGKQVTVGIRSEDILISREHLTQTSARNVLPGRIVGIITDPDKAELIVDCGVDFKVSVTPATVRILKLEMGNNIYLLIKARALHVLA
ncbi:MAG: cysA 1 [Acidobacteria bacterium]|jgi:molybdate transport system ATP-binding protein|nr:cysA 1 [Acidobacteriota bacterium]